MPNDRRAFIPGGTSFFTVKTELNVTVLGELAAVRLLETIHCEAKQRWPLDIAAMVLLPDHLHAIWTLPPSVRTADPTRLVSRKPKARERRSM